MSIESLCEFSNFYGSNPGYVLGGGGNTSYKDDKYLYVKASGTSLATICADGFVKMERSVLTDIMTEKYEGSDSETEAKVLDSMMNARAKGEESKRPSVEALLHALFPQKYVLHLHPAVVNGITCSQTGSVTIKVLFGDNAIWIPEIKPGYTLAVRAKNDLDSYFSRFGKACGLIFLQNHGVFFAADSRSELDSLFDDTMKKISVSAGEAADLSPVTFDEEKAAHIAPAIRMLTMSGNTGFAVFDTNKAVLSLMEENGFENITTFTPDHIVYCKSKIVFASEDDFEEKINAYKNEFGYAPVIVAIKGLGYYACAAGMKAAANALAVFRDALKISFYAKAYGGVRYLSNYMVNFIRTWEVESYRSKIAAKQDSKRLSGKISIVTGAAQGFGEGIAKELCREGAHVAIADMNEAGAIECAKKLCEAYGAYAAVPVTVNVADEESVKAMLRKVVLNYGGLDLFVSNAGILRSGGLEEISVSTFELMTKVNYVAYFICVKYASEYFKIQNKYNPDYYTDIIQINSKSGLTGSNKNFAYAGGKFGGIGLTQSFALELVPFNIKVNAVCPGNFYEGPLWNDPEKGLFVQYLRAGKIPGAKTVADVRRAYEDKCPMRRGCTATDVARAIFYIIEQVYETGQALPVTGGQTMLK